MTAGLLLRGMRNETLFALNRPAEYPQVFNPDHPYDAWHLNEKDGVDCTSALAEGFIEQVKPR